MLVRFETCSLKFTAMWWFKENPVWRSLFGRRRNCLVRLFGTFWEGVRSKAGAKVILFLLHQRNFLKNSIFRIFGSMEF